MSARDALYPVGCTAGLEEINALEDGRYEIVSVGHTRFRLIDIDATAGTPYLIGLVERLGESDGDGAPIFARSVARHFDGYRDLLGGDTAGDRPVQAANAVLHRRRGDAAGPRRPPAAARAARHRRPAARRAGAAAAGDRAGRRAAGRAGHGADADPLRAQLAAGHPTTASRRQPLPGPERPGLGSCRPGTADEGVPHAQTVKGVIARTKGAPVEVVDIVVPDPGPGEAVVKIQACGVCHTDLHYREGGINDEFPFLLGHEAAGVVEAVGEGVTEVAPGDFVILNWRAVCGQCRACAKGKP